ncbi:MAG: hypothetical protein K8S20_10710 [Chloroflexi bacterium]|nr:hypothetical protein [Chloroflexota bacterium]
MDNHDDLIIRVGTFFYVLGGGAFVLFMISDLADQADFDYFFVAVVLLAIGWVFRRRKPPPPPAGRFEYLRKMREEARARRAARSKK